MAIVLACSPERGEAEGAATPGWAALPGLPPACRIERALNPESLNKLSWSPCSRPDGSAIEGCRVSRSEEQIRVVGAWRDGTRSWLRMLGGSLDEGRILALTALDGPIWIALREPRQDDAQSCRVTAQAVGGGRAGFTVQFVDRRVLARSGAWLYIASLDSPASPKVPAFDLSARFAAGSQTITGLWLSRQLVALRTSPDGSLYRLRGSTLELLNGATLPGLPQHVNLVGDHLLWESWRDLDHVRLAHARSGEPAAIWRDRSGGDTKSFATDGVDMAWMQGRDRRSDGAYRTLELYAARYRQDLERVEPRRIRSMTTRNSAVVGGGWYALRRSGGDGPPRVEVYSLRDGTRRTFSIPGGLVADDPYYASRGEIMFSGRATIRFDPRLLEVDSEPRDSVSLPQSSSERAIPPRRDSLATMTQTTDLGKSHHLDVARRRLCPALRSILRQ